VETSESILQKQKENGVGRCYRGNFPYIGPRSYEIHPSFRGWHLYILPSKQVPDAQQREGSEMVDVSTTAHCDI
jgi:hypothetical protein